jgi:hypothetical protein
MTDDNDSLKSPPSGGKMKLPDAQSKPWEALGISRATWYRRDKPTEKPAALGEWLRRKELNHWKSKRTVERVHRIMEFDRDLALLVLDGHIKPAQAERIICDPVKYQHFLQWFTDQLDLTEYVLWIVRKATGRPGRLSPEAASAPSRDTEISTGRNRGLSAQRVNDEGGVDDGTTWRTDK